MRKKPATRKSTTHRSKRKVRSRAPETVTAKAQTEQLKRALSRFKARQTHTQLLDHAVPEASLFQGVLGSYAAEDKPMVDLGEHAPSPFILSLKPKTPEQFLETSAAPSFAINFLHAHSKTVIANQEPVVNLSQDLTLTPEELTHQLSSDLLSSRGWSRLSLPLTSRLDLPPLESLTKPSITHEALRRQAQMLPSFSADTFVPHRIPEDIFSYFDFPEDEEAKPEESVLLDEFDLETEEPQQQKQRQTWTWKWPTLPAFNRAIASFVALSFIFVLPLHAMNVVQDLREAKSSLEQTGGEAVSLLSTATQAALTRNATQAGSDFQAAGERFDSAKQTIAELGAGTDALLSVIPIAGETYTSGQALVTAGSELAIAGSRLSAGYAAMEAELTPTPISRLNLLEAYLSSTTPHLETAHNALSQVDLTSVPEAYQTTLQTLRTTLPALIQTIAEFEDFYALAKQLLGTQGAKRYLVVFQNNTELRPTGGFIGSFAEVKIRDGIIEHLQVPGGGSYDLQGSLKEDVMAPGPLQILSARWEFQDGNWFPDFPTSARQLMQFYQDAGGGNVDGVLAVNATFVANLIGLLGPIEMEDYGRTINAENFIFEAQKIVELEYDKEENRPKAFIGDLAPLLVKRTIEKTSEDFLTVVDYLNNGLSSKELQLYLADETLQREIIARGWGGEMKWTDGDYLMVVDTNLGGGKTDGVIQQEVDMQVNIDDDGTITNTLTISRTHFGIQGLLFTGVNNVDYLRVYVPKGSTLISASGFSIPDRSLFDIPDENWVIDDDLAYGLLTQETDPASGTTISEEHGKAVFGNWVQTKPGTTSVVTFTYMLPFTIDTLTDRLGMIERLKTLVGIPRTQEYHLTIQKQSGVLDRSTHVHMHLPEGLNPIWTSHESADAYFSNQTDALFAILFENL